MSGSSSHSTTSGRSSRRSSLALAREGDRGQLGQVLESHRHYLTYLAKTHLDAKLHARVNPSDVVQEAMLGAYRDFHQFRGSREQDLLVWLRKILKNCLNRAYERHLGAACRDVRREISLTQVCQNFDDSAQVQPTALADPQPSPSSSLRNREQGADIAKQLAELPPDYREVILLRVVEGLPFDEVAARMNRNPGAIRMLWLRAIEKFKQVYEPAP